MTAVTYIARALLVLIILAGVCVFLAAIREHWRAVNARMEDLLDKPMWNEDDL